MCGIVAVLSRPAARQPPAAADIVISLVSATSASIDVHSLTSSASALEDVNRALQGVPGITTLLESADLLQQVIRPLDVIDGRIAEIERSFDEGGLAGVDVEAVNAGIVRLKDASWAIRNDRLRTAAAVGDLAGPAPSASAIEAYHAIQLALSGIDRLEVRGRDSAGIHVLVTGHGLDLSSAGLRAEIGHRTDPLFRSGAVSTPSGHLAVVYKAAAEIGELGDNTRALRAAIRADELLRRAVSSEGALVTVLGHTRWASVGIISEPNAHPVNSDELERTDGPYVAAALNGDVDNYGELQIAEGLRVAPEITTDTKVIPTIVSRRLAHGLSPVEAFRSAVASFEGSVAIGAVSADDPDRLYIAQRGSGQALYVGFADDCFIVASEPYGLVEVTSRYVRLDGEAAGPDGSQGQIVVVDRARAGSIDGVTRLTYGGRDMPVHDGDVHTAEITTRDIDRAGYRHFLLKELTEASQSVRKTLRGKVVDHDGRLTVVLGDDTLPPSLRARLAAGEIRRVLVIGQGTAAVAGLGVAAAITDALTDALTDVRAERPIVTALPATELSGFGLSDDMSDTLVVAISQSGTTTDTNRTVDLVRSRGAVVLAIVNRRNSDLVEKADGVLFTSDGRDVEMSVASTKAFYSQIVAGFVLARGIAGEFATNGRTRTNAVLAALRGLPAAMDNVLARRADIAVAAQRHAPSRRHWAVVGNGPNLVAAEEVRIKLSELCYKSIACDATEDKKHIDLSSEPLILVCAPGLDDATASDVAKEVAIYRAHKAAPIVVATDGEHRFGAAVEVLGVPAVDPSVAFVLAAMVGHLFGYEAALAIDAQARELREARAAVEAVLEHPSDELLVALAPRLEPVARRFFSGLLAGDFNGSLEAGTAVRLASLFRYATGMVPLDIYELEHGRVSSPAAVVEDLLGALTQGIDELTRPVDAIKHQAKTVTVGISRAEDAHLDAAVVREVLATGTPRDRLTYRVLRRLAALDAAVAEVTGWTRYDVEGSVDQHLATLHVIDRGGVARGIASRTDRDPRLRGTKHRAAFEREVTVARGSDGRTLVIVPEVKDNRVTGITLLHTRFHDRLPADDARRVLTGYRGRYGAIVDAVTEHEPNFDDSRLGELSLFDLLERPVHVLAEHWRRPS
jgi:glucosamine--fructose-6-phosphate aminotransferase (isomerizing)